MNVREILTQLGIADHPRLHAGTHAVVNPATKRELARVALDDAASYERTLSESVEAFARWREVPAPARGLVVRAIGDEFKRLREPLGAVITLEVGKILSEGVGEVQEAVDIADFALGLSRQLYGLTMPSERARHRIMEQWHPLGLIGVISAFNFPCAVWAWNSMIAAVCGDITIWKPSLLAPLTAIASASIADRVATSMGHPGIFPIVLGSDVEIGERLIADRRIALVSATGSCRMGRRVAQVVGGRLGRTLLELGGNNAAIVCADADLDLALKAVTFSAIGTAGQRCTSTRRLFVHESVAADFVARLARAYSTVRIGDPASSSTLVGPVISAASVDKHVEVIERAKQEGGTVVIGGGRASTGLDGYFVEPTIIRAPASNRLEVAMEETFSPILYVFTFSEIDEAIARNNEVAMGLSAAIFTRDVTAAERFVAPAGTDTGLAYVNLGTSGAEIGGAFGGEKDTGGGRESGSDAWKAYMRRQTATVNGSGGMTLAQGIRFE